MSDQERVIPEEEIIPDGEEMDSSDDEIIEEEEEEEARVYLPGKAEPGENDHLVYDKTAYEMYHATKDVGAPCLSFDFVTDPKASAKGDGKYPASIQLVGGSQNHVIAMKCSNLHKRDTSNDDAEKDSDDEDESDEEELDEAKRPLFESCLRQHRGGVNRIRYTSCQDRRLAATWSENGSVHIYDVKPQMAALKSASAQQKYKKDKEARQAPPMFTFSGSMGEGFAMDWSNLKQGELLTGDCKNNIFHFKPVEGGLWSVNQKPFSGHTGSVEDVKWFPNQASVFASCSVDRSIRVWDMRKGKAKAAKVIAEAHTSDVNVIDWSVSQTTAFILSGGDDGVIKVWDQRNVTKPLASFKHHTAPITSVEWCPHDAGVFAASGADNQLTLWDLGAEKDDDESDAELKEVPSQLLFIHQGQQDIKELHWHKQYKGLLVSTAADGFNVFKTISV